MLQEKKLQVIQAKIIRKRKSKAEKNVFEEEPKTNRELKRNAQQYNQIVDKQWKS